jgi:hypothetical protein
MKIFNGSVVKLQLSEKLTPYEVVCLHCEVFHFEYHLFDCVEVFKSDLWFLGDSLDNLSLLYLLYLLLLNLNGL